MKRQSGGSGDLNVHVMEPGDVVVQMESESYPDSNWHIGSVISSEGKVSRKVVSPCHGAEDDELVLSGC